MKRQLILFVAWATATSVLGAAPPVEIEKLAKSLRELDPHVLSDEQREAARSMVREDLRGRLQLANDRSSAQWHEVKTREQWEAFVEPKIAALRKSLGQFPEPPKKPDVRVTGKLAGDGFVIHNVVYKSRGLWVPANLYLPEKPSDSMPGIILCHSHHRPKEQGELQDMGMTWARAGCAVLVPELIGHGERRQHPFRSAEDYDGEFRVSRQDYYFRYDTGIQLHLVGESLIGWMAWDLMRGVDVLLAQDGIDPKRIALLGAVAGGGDPCAVTAAVDERITCAVPFNFGGPQPETRFPLPEDSEKSFNYAGSGGWESTRNLQQSAHDGFLPWVIVGSIAPRRLIFAHEFNWDMKRDPVWKRLNSIYKMHKVPDHLAFAHGRGELRGSAPEASHCTNIGGFHRRLIHEAFKEWWEIEATEYSKPVSTADLQCLTAGAEKELQPRKLHEVLTDLAQARGKEARQGDSLRESWVRVLGNCTPYRVYSTSAHGTENSFQGVSETHLEFELPGGIVVPMLQLDPPGKRATSRTFVIAVAQAGKERFLQQRSHEVAELLAGGATVCLPDLRGTGVSQGGSDRGQYSAATGRSSTELMLGGTQVGKQLRDLRTVIQYLRKTYEGCHISLWGDSLVEANALDADFQVPRRVDGRLKQSEPLGGLLALLGGLFEDDVQSVYVRGGLTGFQSVLESQHVYVPHDVVIPGVLTTGDLADVAAAIAPRRLRLDGLVDGLNRPASVESVKKTYVVALESYRKSGAESNIIISDKPSSPAKWLLPTDSDK